MLLFWGCPSGGLPLNSQSDCTIQTHRSRRSSGRNSAGGIPKTGFAGPLRAHGATTGPCRLNCA
eukprot:7843937-Alexandrium_andersonii.AAC.1